ncbi:MAG: hypothetical protein MJ061_00235 [Mailhella sp.]|nr:hypothetical protein [Mailhella sp.]
MESFLLNPLPTRIEDLERQIAVIDEEQKRCTAAIRDLMDREDIGRGIVFPMEIHELHQRKNMLETHKQYRRVRINRLRLGRGAL